MEPLPCLRGMVLVAGLFGTLLFGGSADDSVSEIAQQIRAGQYKQAVELARAAREREPQNVRILSMEAISLSALGQVKDALAAYDLALKLAPDYLPALEGAAQIEYKAGSKNAIPLLDRLLKLRPNDPTAHAMRAVMAWNQNDCETAVSHFALSSKAIAANPDALHEYAVCLSRLRRPAEAVPILRELSALEPGDQHVRYGLADAQFMTQDYKGAISTLAPLMSEKDPDADALDLASAAWEAIGETPRAVAALRRAIMLRPENARYYLDFASISLAHNSFQAGIAMIDAGLGRLPNDARLYVARGVLKVQLGKYSDADEDFIAAERIDPRQAYGSIAEGLSEIQQSDFDTALATVREQLKTRHNDAFLYYVLAEILTSQSATVGSPEFQEAVRAASRAIELNPNFTPARDVLSRLLFLSGDNAGAIEQCRLALRDDPLDATALYHLIRALQKSGKASDQAEIPALLERFKEVRQQLSRNEDEKARYKLLVEGQTAER